MFKALQLTRLDLSINMELLSQAREDDWDSWGFWNKPWMKRALSGLKSLTHLHLHLSAVQDYVDFQDLDTVPWMDLRRILPTPYDEAWPHLHYLGLANVITTEDGLYNLLSSLPALTGIDLDSIVLRINDTTVTFGPMESLLRRIKASIISTDNNGAPWRDRTRAPRWTIRYQGADQPDRVTYYNDAVHNYLYGDGSNPCAPENYGTAWSLEDFAESTRMLNNDKYVNVEQQEQQKLMGLLLYPPPTTSNPKEAI